MRIVKYILLVLFLWNVPSYLLAYFGPVAGSISSYASSLLLFAFFFLVKRKHKPAIPFIVLGLLYFTICSLSFSGVEALEFLKEFIRFMIFVVCAGELVHRTTRKDIYIILLIGGLSIVINAVVFPLANANFYPTYGRYSGFYLNPNFAGVVCLTGYALSYTIRHKWLRIGGQLLFSLAGILTFSRTFIVLWLLVNIVAAYRYRRNLMAPLIGGSMLVLVFMFSDKLSLNTERFGALRSIFSSERVQTKIIQKDVRTETWAIYTEMILENPIWGNGYQKLQIKTARLPGVHNSYLMVLGEAGILPFLVMLSIYGYLIFKSYAVFSSRPEFLYISVVMAASLMVGHGYFSNFFSLLISMFLFVHLRTEREESSVIKKPLNEVFLEN